MGVISLGLKAFKRKPGVMIKTTVEFFAGLLMSFFMVSGFGIAFYFASSLIGVDFSFMEGAQYGIALFFFIMFLYLSMGLKGAYIRSLYEIMKRKERHPFSEMVSYAIFHGRKPLVLGLMFIASVLIASVPEVLVYHFLGPFDGWILWVLVFAWAFLASIFSVPFLLSITASSVYGYSVRRSLDKAIYTIKKKPFEVAKAHLFALLSSALLLVPLVNFVSLFFLYPWSQVSLIRLYQRR